jgi:hypothetical protein
LIPLKDDIPTDRFPILVVVLIAINVAVFGWQTQYPTDPALDRAGLTAVDQSGRNLSGQTAEAFWLSIEHSEPMIVGVSFYALSQRIMGLPAKMLSEAASKVFIGEIHDAAAVDLRRYFLRAAALFTGLGLLGAVPMVVVAPSLFALVFGEEWREAGVIAQLLIPLYLMRFIVQPISMILYYLKRQELHLLGAGLNGLALVVSFGCGYIFDLDARITNLLFSLTSGGSFFLTLYLSWQLARQTTTAGSAEV